MSFTAIKNFSGSKLAAQLIISGDAIAVNSGDGPLFPVSGQFIGVLWGAAFASISADPNHEIVLATYSSGDSFAIVRAQEGTSARQWEINDNFTHIITAGKIKELQDAINLNTAAMAKAKKDAIAMSIVFC